MALGVHVAGCAGRVVLESRVMLEGVLSLRRCGFGSGCGSQVPGLAWPWAWWLLWLRGVQHILVGQRGGVGGERRGERCALHDPIFLKIVERVLHMSCQTTLHIDRATTCPQRLAKELPNPKDV